MVRTLQEVDGYIRVFTKTRQGLLSPAQSVLASVTGALVVVDTELEMMVDLWWIDHGWMEMDQEFLRIPWWPVVAGPATGQVTVTSALSQVEVSAHGVRTTTGNNRHTILCQYQA